MKTSASFRLSKYAKRLVALGKFNNEDDRGHYRRCLIDGQVAASIRPVTKRNRDVNNMPIADSV